MSKRVYIENEYFEDFKKVRIKHKQKSPDFNPINRIFSVFWPNFLFSENSYRFFMNLPQLAAPKNLHKKVFCFTEKYLRFQNFLAFYRKLVRAENILGRIKPRIYFQTFIVHKNPLFRVNLF